MVYYRIYVYFLPWTHEVFQTTRNVLALRYVLQALEHERAVGPEPYALVAS